MSTSPRVEDVYLVQHKEGNVVWTGFELESAGRYVRDSARDGSDMYSVQQWRQGNKLRSWGITEDGELRKHEPEGFDVATAMEDLARKSAKFAAGLEADKASRNSDLADLRGELEKAAIDSILQFAPLDLSTTEERYQAVRAALLKAYRAGALAQGGLAP